MGTLKDLFEITYVSQSYKLYDANSGDIIGEYDSREDIPEEYLNCLVMEQKAHYNDLYVDIVMED